MKHDLPAPSVLTDLFQREKKKLNDSHSHSDTIPPKLNPISPGKFVT